MTLLRLQCIDKAVAKTDHPYLSPQHNCYFLREYTSGQGYDFGTTNQLMINLKKAMSRQGRPEWRYKEEAIHQLARRVFPPSTSRSANIDLAKSFGWIDGD